MRNWVNSFVHGDTAASVLRGKSFFQKSKTRLAKSITADARTADSATGESRVMETPKKKRMIAANKPINASRLNQPSPWQSTVMYEAQRFPKTTNNETS